MIRNKPIKLLVLTLLLLALGSLLFAACARPGESGTANTANQGNTQSTATAGSTATTPATGGTATAPATSGGGATTSVHMGQSNFVQNTVTISKGSSITLVDDAAVPHIINNGSWNGNTPKPATEAGAPTVNVQFAGSDSKQIGPFNTAGTFHLYCTIHPGMNLTVTVH